MAKVAITEQYLEDIADAIRSKTGMSSATYYPSEMAGAIMTISGGGGITPTGTISITENGTYNVTTYASADVDVPTGSTINNQNKTVSPSTSQQSVTYDSGYTGLGTVTVNAMPSGTAGTPTATKGTVSSNSINVTPSVTNTTGYIIGETKTGTAVTISASELVSGNKSITANGNNIDVTNYATVSVNVSGGGSPTLQSKSYTVDSTGTVTIEADSGYDGLSEVEVNVPSGNPDVTWVNRGFYTESNQRKWRVQPYCDFPDGEGYGWMGNSVVGDYLVCPAVLSNTYITPTESAQTIGGANYMMEGVVTVNAIPSNYVGSGITQRSSSDLTASGATVTVPSGYYSAQATKSVANGTAGTPTATKGTVSNHQVSVTPSVTNTTGYITGSTKTGTAVTVSASELVSGTYSVSASGTHDVTNYASASVPSLSLHTSASSSATGTKKGSIGTSLVTQYLNIPTGYNNTAQYYELEPMEVGEKTITENGTYYSYMDGYSGYNSVTVNVSGGGGSSMQIGNLEEYATSSSISFTGLQGEPTAFSIMVDTSVATGTPSKIVAVVFDGTSLHAQTITNTANAQVTYDSTSLSKTYSNGTLTITSNGPSFVLDAYYGVYVYDGGAVETKDVQVGSGATSITFTGLEAEPAWWSCIFKSNFSTSSGYQRVIYVAEGNTTGDVSGLEMDSGAHNAIHWTASYNNGSLTITSQSTNVGGYFHQPGYYQLTYAYDDGSSGNYQSKTVTPTTSQQVITADSGYDALKQVTVNAMPTGSATAPSTISGTSATVSTGTNTLTLTKTISVTPTVSAGYVSSGTAGNSSVSLTASVTTKAAATITPTTTNQTIAAGTYLTGIQTIAGDADLVGGNILSTANIFGVKGTVVVQNYYTGSSAPSSSTGSNGDLYLQL